MAGALKPIWTVAHLFVARRSFDGGSSTARYVYDGDGNRVFAIEDGVTTLYIGNYFEAELGTGTTYPVFVPDLIQDELPYKLYLPVILNSSEKGGGVPQVGPGFYLTHPITPNQESITWRMYYYAGGTRVAMREAIMPVVEPQPMPTPQPYPAPTPTQSAYQENFFNRFVTFLKDLFGVKTVSAAPLAVDAPAGEVYFLLSDHLGSTTITLDTDGDVVSEIRYSAWGATRYTSGTTPTERHYTGQIEEEAGLYFYNARWYDDSLGRFIQPDSIVPEAIQGTQAWDRYAYSNNNSIRNSDSSGHCIGPLITLCLIAAAYIADNAAIIASVAITGAILSFVGPSNPDPVLINDPVASQQALDNSTFQAYGWLTLGQTALEFSSMVYSSRPNQGSAIDESSPSQSLNNKPPSRSPDFIGTEHGDIIVIPNGAKGPQPARNGAGYEYLGGYGGNGLNERVSGVRIMDPTQPKPPSPGYPNGYVTYSNSSGQAVNPLTGRTISKSDPWWHIQLSVR